MNNSQATLPREFLNIRNDFTEADKQTRLQLLVEFSQSLPELPERYQDHPELFERVEECQSPVYIFLECDENNVVHFFATAPEQAPTTRGFASMLAHGFSGLTLNEALSVPRDFPHSLSLAEVISPLRLRGMSAMLSRTHRQLLAFSRTRAENAESHKSTEKTDS